MFFVSTKELKQRGFKFFKLLVFILFDWHCLQLVLKYKYVANMIFIDPGPPGTVVAFEKAVR